MISSRGFKKEEKESGFDDSYISIVVPVYNDPKGISDTLTSLTNQDYPKNNFEIIVVDNGSTDDTQDVVKKFVQAYPGLIKLVMENTIRSSYAARNKGIESARGSIIAFIDADMSVDADWLTKIRRSSEKKEWDYLACGVEIYFKNRSIYEIYDKITGFPIADYVRKGHFAPTCCLVVRKKIFEELGAFDPRLISGGDHEFGTRAYQKGIELIFDEDVTMRHPARSSFKDLYNKHFRLGRGHKQLKIYYPERYLRMFRGYSNPRRYLPYNPWKYSRLKSRDGVWKELSFKDRVKIYFIDWMLKFVSGFGYFYESSKNMNP